MRNGIARPILCGLLGWLAAAAPADKNTGSANVEAENIENGAETYETFCSTCHGADLQNNTGVAFDLRRLHAQEHPRFVNSVTHGKQAMPAWQGTLSDQQIESLWAYIRANAYDAH